MSGKSESRRGRPPISAASKSAFVWAIRAGASRVEAASAGGYALNSFYRAARRDAGFRAALDAAYAASAEAERREAVVAALLGEAPGLGAAARIAAAAGASAAGGGEERIAGNNFRLLQRRKMRHVRFDARRQEVFLAHFRWSGDLGAAALAAGVCERTVYNYRRRDAAFAAAFQTALEQAWQLLGEELLRQRLGAAERLRRAVEEAEPDGLEPGRAAFAGADPGEEFERIMKLLRRWETPRGEIGPRHRRPSARHRMSFDDAILELDRALRVFGLNKGLPPAEPIPPWPGVPAGGG